MALGGMLGQVGGHVETRDGELDQSVQFGARVADLWRCVDARIREGESYYYTIIINILFQLCYHRNRHV